MATEAMNGKIEAESRQGKGSSFFVTLPYSNEISENTKSSVLENHKKTLYLTDEELKILKPYIEKLKTFEIFEITLIRTELAKLKDLKSANIKQWVKEYENAVSYANEQTAKELLNICTGRF